VHPHHRPTTIPSEASCEITKRHTGTTESKRPKDWALRALSSQTLQACKLNVGGYKRRRSRQSCSSVAQRSGVGTAVIV